MVRENLINYIGLQHDYDNINCIFCNKQNVLNKISWILDTKNRATVDLIRKKGMILVRKKHNTRVRSKQLDNIVNKYFKNSHQDQFFHDMPRI